MRSERLALHERLEAVAARYDLAAIERDGRGRDHRIELGRILRIPENIDEPHRRDRLELVIERLGVANHDNRQGIAPEHTLRRGAGASATHGGEPFPVPLQVIRGEAEQSRGRHDRGDLPWRLDCERERANEESLGRSELAIGDDLGADPVDLMQQLRERAVGDLRSAFERRLPIAEAAVTPQGGVRAIGPALLFAQNLKKPRIATAAQHVRGDARRIIAGIGRCERRVPDYDVRLHRPRSVHEQNVGAALRGHSGRDHGRGRPAAPRSELARRQRLGLGQRDVAGHDKQRGRWTQSPPGERHDVVACDRLVGCDAGVSTVGIPAVDLLLECACRDVVGLRQLHFEGRQEPRPRQLQLPIGERCSSNHIAQQRERQVCMIAEHVGRDGQEIVARARPDTAADPFDLSGDLLRGARGGPFGQ